jgi:predicted porin
VTLYGQVNKSVLWWDDGAEKNTYVVDNNYESSRFGFKGSAKISGDWSAGYRIEIETITAQSNLVNQFNPGGDPSFGALNVRHSYMYIDNKKWGQVRWGLTATPIYNIYAVYQHFTADVDLVDSSLNHVAAPLDDFQLFYSGARIYF